MPKLGRAPIEPSVVLHGASALASVVSVTIAVGSGRVGQDVVDDHGGTSLTPTTATSGASSVMEPTTTASEWSVWRAEAHALATADVLLLGWMAAMSIAHLTFFVYSSWSSRFIVLLLLVPYGAVRLVGLAAGRDRSALAWCAFGAALVVAALASPAPRIGLIGVGGSSQSAVFFVVLACVWAAGRFASEQARSLAQPVLLACLGLHLLVGVLQVGYGIDSGPLATFSGRGSGLAANPVYFGALMTFGVVVSAWRLFSARSMAWMLVLALSSFGVSLSGSRVAFASCVVVLVALGIMRRPVAWPRVVLGVIVGVASSEVFSRIVGARTSLERVATGGDDGRLSVWSFGVRAFLDRPLLGWGPDRFRIAIQDHVSDSFVIQNDAIGRVGWTDPHNLVLGIAVGSGVLGLSALVVLAAVLARTTSGPLAAAAAAVVVTWLLQPLFIITAPIVALLLGMASNDHVPDIGERGRVLRRDVQLALVAIGVAIAGTVAVIDVRIATANNVGDAGEAWKWYWRDPVVADDIADKYAVAAFELDGGYATDAIAWSERAVDYQPNRAVWWARLGSRHLLFGDVDQASAAASRALELQPNEPQAWVVMRSVARESGDQELEQRADERVCTLVPDRC